ncbi:MAG: GNAT family N-acetyltransferase [Synechocystis sp.]|nr:GNAT family N-acetyltransferase [Synechocystis sp.]
MTPLPYSIRAALPSDLEAIAFLIHQLAVYEKLEHQVTGNIANLQDHLFGPNPKIEALIADVEGNAVGFALFFTNYSTFLMQPGLYLEDLFVLPAYRRLGIGKALLGYLKTLAQGRGYGRFEWSVLDWNKSAIAFYESFGAEVLPDWRTCRILLSAEDIRPPLDSLG